jgi:hypothetical protein
METDRLMQLSVSGGYDGRYYALLERMAARHVRKLGRVFPDAGSTDLPAGNASAPCGGFGGCAAVRVSPAGFAARTEDEAFRITEALAGAAFGSETDIRNAKALALAVFMARRGCTKSEICERIGRDYYPRGFRDESTAVPRAMDAFFEAASFESAVRAAIALGGDSGSLAAIAGAVAEAYYGVPEGIKTALFALIDPRLVKICRKWAAFTGEDGAGEFRVLTKYLHRLPETPCRREMLAAFMRDFYDFSESHAEYVLPQYSDTLVKAGIKPFAEDMRAADASALGAEALLALIMAAIRSDHFAEGALLACVESGAVGKWLERLRGLDEAGAVRKLEELYLEISAARDRRVFRVIFDSGAAVLCAAPKEGLPLVKELSAEETAALKHAFAALGTEGWRYQYADPGLSDGICWRLMAKYSGQRPLVWQGNGVYPPGWEKLPAIFGITGPDGGKLFKTKLRRFIIALRSDETPAHYSECLLIDRGKGLLILKERYGQGRAATHVFELLEAADALLLTAQGCLEEPGWTGPEHFSAEPGARFYELAAEYYDGPTLVRSGIYDRRAIPEKGWKRLLSAIEQLIGFCAPCRLLDMESFMNVRKNGELIYCSVSFDDSGRTFFYIAEDARISEGDFVRVPFGAANEERVGLVEEIGYYAEDAAPFPAGRTKRIIGKA